MHQQVANFVQMCRFFHEKAIGANIIKINIISKFGNVERLTMRDEPPPCPSEGGENGRETSPSPSEGGVIGETLAAKRADETLAAKSPSFGGVGEVPRFRFPYGSKCSIYNLPVMKMLRPQEPLYITEGCSDCWAMLSAGNKAIAIPSATLLMAKDVKMISELVNRLSTPLHMFPDRDEPGERLFMQLKQLLPNLEHHQLPLGCKDFGEWWGKSLSPRPLLGEGA